MGTWREINRRSNDISTPIVEKKKKKKIENIHYAVSRANRGGEKIPQRLVSKVPNIADIFTLCDFYLSNGPFTPAKSFLLFSPLPRLVVEVTGFLVRKEANRHGVCPERSGVVIVTRLSGECQRQLPFELTISTCYLGFIYIRSYLCIVGERVSAPVRTCVWTSFRGTCIYLVADKFIDLSRRCRLVKPDYAFEYPRVRFTEISNLSIPFRSFQLTRKRL